MKYSLWIARDKDGTLVLFKDKPVRCSIYKDKWVSFGINWENFTIDESLFPDLKWEDEPVEVKLELKYKKNGVKCHFCKKEFFYNEEDIDEGSCVICPDCKNKICILE